MPRREIQFVKRGYYHIYNRGAGRQSIFRGEDNYVYLLRLIKEVVADVQVTMVAYCLLPNHYHWLVRQDGETPAGQLFNSYVKAFNKAYHRSGTLFEDRFKAIPVDTDEYLYDLCRYIHGNPVRHGIALSPDLWPYSNYLEWIRK